MDEEKMAGSTGEEVKKPAGGYGTNWGKAILWYVIAAIVIYGIVWYFWLR